MHRLLKGLNLTEKYAIVLLKKVQFNAHKLGSVPDHAKGFEDVRIKKGKDVSEKNQ